MARKKILSSGLYSTGGYSTFTNKEWRAVTKVASKLDCGWGHEEFWEGYITAVLDCTLYISPTGVKPYFNAMQEAGAEWGRMMNGNKRIDFEDLFKTREVSDIAEWQIDECPGDHSLQNGDWERAQAAHCRAVAEYLKRQAKRMERAAKEHDRQAASTPIIRPLTEAEKAEDNARMEEAAKAITLAEMRHLIGPWD